jgi:O-methyltransferase
VEPSEAAERLRDAVLSKEAQKAADLPDSAENRMIRTLIDERLTWVDLARLQNLQHLAMQAVPGAFVECGVAQGGSLAFMAALARDRDIWGFDSFEPLPALTANDRGSGEAFVGLQCSGPKGEGAVAATFARLGVPMGRVHVVKGWFEDTLPECVGEIGPIALLRLDSDWYEATRYTLEMLYDSVVPGGVVIIDDYGSFDGCRKAVDDFRNQRSVGRELQRTPETVEAFWVV